MQRLSPLQGQKFQVDYGGLSYVIAICTNASKDHANSSVTEEKQGIPSTVLGRYNDTDIVGGESWLLLRYGSGDSDNSSKDCNSTRKVQVFITCKEEAQEPVLHFLEYNKNWETGCFFSFEIQTSALCPKVGLSNGSVFCIIFLTSFGVYLLIGVAYRRLIGGAKGFEQIPHYNFWKELGNLQADGCNFLCRRDMHREESWRRLTNNFNDPHDDRDDALLRP